MDDEMTSLRRSFRIGMVAVVAFLVAVGGIVAAFGSNADRPAGIAERWLVALSDTTRDGLEDDALERMEEHEVALPRPDGPFFAIPELEDDRGAAGDGEARFDTVHVGRLVESTGSLMPPLVPVEVTPYEADDPVRGYVVMSDTDDGWKVADIVALDVTADVIIDGTPFCPDDECPGFPIERPERAPLGFWLGTLALGVLIAAGCSLAARAATPKPVAS